jgi:hypothetical protein
MLNLYVLLKEDGKTADNHLGSIRYGRRVRKRTISRRFAASVLWAASSQLGPQEKATFLQLLNFNVNVRKSPSMLLSA